MIENCGDRRGRPCDEVDRGCRSAYAYLFFRWASIRISIPEALLQLCQRQGLERVAVTDHDSVGGLERAAAEARRLGLSLVPGVELTARFSGEMHILGYGIRPADCGLADFLQEQLLRRARRNTQMVERLRELGMPLTEEDMRQEAGREEYGRTHMARGDGEKRRLPQH